MCANLYIIIKENSKLVFRQSMYIAVNFLLLVPYIYGIPNLSSERAADCLGKLVALIGIPLFVSILRPEQDSDVRDVIFIKEFPYRFSIIFRIVFATVLSTVMIYCFALYMLYQRCEFPITAYVVRTLEISMLLGGVGLLGSVLLRNTLIGILLSVGFAFLFCEKFAVMVFEGVHGFVVAAGILLYGVILFLCNKC